MSANFSWVSLVAQCSPATRHLLGGGQPQQIQNSGQVESEIQRVFSHFTAVWQSVSQMSPAEHEVRDTILAMTSLLSAQRSHWVDSIILGASRVLTAVAKKSFSYPLNLNVSTSESYGTLVELLSQHSSAVGAGNAPRPIVLEALHAAATSILMGWLAQYLTIQPSVLDHVEARLVCIGSGTPLTSHVPPNIVSHYCTSLEVERSAAVAVVPLILQNPAVPDEYRRRLAIALQQNGMLQELGRCPYTPRDSISACHAIVRQFGGVPANADPMNNNNVFHVHRQSNNGATAAQQQLPPGMPSAADLWIVLHQTEATYQAEMEKLSDLLVAETDLHATLARELEERMSSTQHARNQLLDILSQHGIAIPRGPANTLANKRANQQLEPLMELLLRGVVGRRMLAEEQSMSNPSQSTNFSNNHGPRLNISTQPIAPRANGTGFQNQKENIPSFGGGAAPNIAKPYSSGNNGSSFSHNPIRQQPRQPAQGNAFSRANGNSTLFGSNDNNNNNNHFPTANYQNGGQTSTVHHHSYQSHVDPQRSLNFNDLR